MEERGWEGEGGREVGGGRKIGIKKKGEGREGKEDREI